MERLDRRDVRAWLFYDKQLEGSSTREIALDWRTSVRTVQAEIARVRRQLDSCLQNRPFVPPPKLVPFFPIAAYTPASTCDHVRVPIPAGDPFACGVCWRSGQDDHPAMARDPRTDPKPDRKPPRTPRPETRRTRKERRKALKERRKALVAA